MKSRICLCITGWHFPEAFYRTIRSLTACRAFVVAHVPRERIPGFVTDAVGEDHILVRQNRGYDWGCYQQFLDTGIWRDYDYIFFMHDDLTVRSPAFVEASIEALEAHVVVGNGRLAMGRNYPTFTEESYAHSAWKPPSRAMEHGAVRGSFFATTRRGLETLERFEVFWDRFCVSSGSGNWSTKASCAKWEYRTGPQCFGFLSETQEESDYILEHVRGQAHDTRDRVGSWRILRDVFWNRVYARASKRYMQICWGECAGWTARAGRVAYPPFIALFSGCALRDIRTQPVQLN